MDSPYINIHTHRRSGVGIEMVSVMAGDPRTTRRSLPPPFSIGIHPWQLGGNDGGNDGGFDVAAALREVESAPASAIGETGLDGAIAVDRAEQTTIFEAQLRIAARRNLPVILHCVRAFEPTCEMLAAHHLPGVIFHGFVGSSEQAARAVAAGRYLSFGARSLESPKTVEAMRRTPLENIFLETDDEAIPIATIYARAAQILGRPVNEMATQIEKNYGSVVGKNRAVVR